MKSGGTVKKEAYKQAQETVVDLMGHGTFWFHVGISREESLSSYAHASGI